MSASARAAAQSSGDEIVGVAGLRNSNDGVVREDHAAALWRDSFTTSRGGHDAPSCVTEQA